MLQTMLAGRFKLAFHRETRVVEGYALLAARSGPKLRPSTAEEHQFSSGRGHISGRKLSMPQLAESLSYLLDSPVADNTGVPGEFVIDLRWTPSEPARKPVDPADPPEPTTSDGPTIFTALQEQLGLKLEAHKVPAEILVIDHVDRTPTEN